MLNRLGVLHAQWGKVDIAADYFNRSLKIKAAVPALINLGNLRLLANDPLKAGSYYNQAVELDPRNPNAVLCLARAANLAADYAGALKAWQRLKVLSPDLAEKNAYLAARGDDAARAGAGDAASSIVWEE
jgi:tetratricopeptide (TPR) repeat protein